jgi:hypothetical protein
MADLINIVIWVLFDFLTAAVAAQKLLNKK